MNLNVVWKKIITFVRVCEFIQKKYEIKFKKKNFFFVNGSNYNIITATNCP